MNTKGTRACSEQSLFILSIFDRLHSAIDRNRENIDKELRSNWD